MVKKINKNKMWGGRFSADQDKIMIEMNSSVKFDSRFYTEDINASIAHAKMLAKTKIITSKEARKIVVGLNKIKLPDSIRLVYIYLNIKGKKR